MDLLFIETPLFSRLRPDYLSDDEYRHFQQLLLSNPEAGDLIPGTGGFRKVRWQDSRRGKGKRGGLRVIYYYLTTDRQIWLFTLFDKDELDDLTPEQKQRLKLRIRQELAARRNRDGEEAQVDR